MPLFKKSSVENCNGSLLETHRISLRQCRRVVIKDLDVSSLMDYMTSEDCLRQDQRDAILAFPTREQQATAFLDHLETKGERAFTLFMEALKVRQKHLHAYLNETNQTIDEWDAHWNSAKTSSVNGIALQKMFARQKHESVVQNGRHIENAAGESELQDDCCNYISCYSVTTKGHLQKEKWITHNNSLRTDLGPTERKSYMAVVSASLIFRRIDWTSVKPRVDIKKPPNSNIPIYIFEKECNAACKPVVVAHDVTDSSLLVHKKKVVQEEDAEEEEKEQEEESKSCIPTASARVHASVPPPVPPKPSTLPVRRLEHSLPHSKTPSGVQDIVPLVRSISKTSPEVCKVRPPIPKKKPVLRMPLSQSAHSALRTPVESPLNPSVNCELRKSESNVCKRGSLPEASCPDDVDNDSDFLDYNVSVGSTLELEDILQSGENYNNDADVITNNLINVIPHVNHFDMNEDMAVDPAGQGTVMHNNNGLQIKLTKQPLEESVNHVEVRNSQMNGEMMLRPESQKMPSVSSCPEFDDGRKCNTNGSDAAASAQNDLSPQDEPQNDERLSKTTSESISADKIIEKQDLFFHSQSVDQPVFADDEFSSDNNSYYEEIEQFFSGRSSPSCQSHNAYLDPRVSLVRKRSSNRSSHHHSATEESRKFGRKFLCRNSLLLVSCDAPCTDGRFPGDSSDDVEVKNKPTPELDSGDFSGTSLCFDKDGCAFYVPRQFLKKHGDPEGEIWFYPMKISAREASLFLMCVRQEGCFVVYRPEGSPPDVAYNLSLCLANNDVVHYHILENAHGDYGIQGHDHTFMTVGELIEYFRRNKSSLAARLRRPLRVANQPITPGYHYDVCHELDRNDVLLTGNIIGQGNFGVVCLGMYQGRPVAVKVLQQADNLTAADEDDFIEEALAVMALRHDHIVRFVGVSCGMRPYFLVTEYMSRGNLKNCLRNGFISSDNNVDGLFGVCIQVVSAMQYLENIRFMLHRDLAARNFLVDNDMNVKLADFGRARTVMDDCYQAPRTEKICIKWAAPEVLVHSRYSTKSDVWSFGVVLWEVFSAGARPFSIFSGEQTAMYVTGGGRLDKPSKCPSDIYEILRCCWCEEPDDRPSFCELSETLKGLSSVGVSRSLVRRFHSRSLSSDATNLSPNSATEKNPSQRKSVTSSIFGTNSLRKTYYDTKSSKSDASHENLIRSKGKDAQHILNREGPLLNYLSDLSIASACSELVDIDREDVSRGDRIRKSLRKLITKKSKTKFNELSGKSVPATQEFVAVQ